MYPACKIENKSKRSANLYLLILDYPIPSSGLCWCPNSSEISMSMHIKLPTKRQIKEKQYQYDITNLQINQSMHKYYSGNNRLLFYQK